MFPDMTPVFILFFVALGCIAGVLIGGLLAGLLVLVGMGDVAVVTWLALILACGACGVFAGVAFK